MTHDLCCNSKHIGFYLEKITFVLGLCIFHLSKRLFHPPRYNGSFLFSKHPYFKSTSKRNFKTEKSDFWFCTYLPYDKREWRNYISKKFSIIYSFTASPESTDILRWKLSAISKVSRADTVNACQLDQGMGPSYLVIGPVLFFLIFANTRDKAHWANIQFFLNWLFKMLLETIRINKV